MKTKHLLIEIYQRIQLRIKIKYVISVCGRNKKAYKYRPASLNIRKITKLEYKTGKKKVIGVFQKYSCSKIVDSLMECI